MAGATVATVATGTARGLLMLRLSPDTAMAATAVDTATDMAVATDTTARGPLMPSLRLMPLLRLSPVTAMAAMAVDTDTAMAATDTAAMVATVVVMVATATARVC